MFDIPLAKLNGITHSKLCELQTEDNSLRSLQKLAKDSKEGCFYKDGVFMSTVSDHRVKRKVIVVPKPLRARSYKWHTIIQVILVFLTHILL